MSYDTMSIADLFAEWKSRQDQGEPEGVSESEFEEWCDRQALLERLIAQRPAQSLRELRLKLFLAGHAVCNDSAPGFALCHDDALKACALQDAERLLGGGEWLAELTFEAAWV